MKKCVIFDFDGTLANSKAVAFQVINQLADIYGFPKFSPEKAMIMHGQEKSLLTQFPIIANDFYKLYKEALQEIPLFDGIREVLLQLKDLGVEIAVISSNEESNIRQYFRSQGMDFITEVYTSSDLYGKDTMIDAFCDKHQLSKDEVLYVGDEVRDIRACHKSGISVVWVNWGYDTEEHALTEKPTYTATEPAELLALVK
ncbi:MAG: HAD-IA family hydrolase [Bacillus sp. (in: firmicutes)]